MNALTEMHKSRKTQRFHPLRRQIAAVFIGFLLLSLIAITMINGLFREKYYIAKKTETLTQAANTFEKIQNSSNPEGTWSTYITDEIYKKSSEKNLSWTIITWDGQTVASMGSNDAMLENRLIGYVYQLDQDKGRQKTLKQTDTYIIQQVSDRFADMDYVESWGTIGDEYYFLIRTPLESIRESVSISNSFYLYVVIMIILVSSLSLWIITKRITKPISELTLLC